MEQSRTPAVVKDIMQTPSIGSQVPLFSDVTGRKSSSVCFGSDNHSRDTIHRSDFTPPSSITEKSNPQLSIKNRPTLSKQKSLSETPLRAAHGKPRLPGPVKEFTVNDLGEIIYLELPTKSNKKKPSNRSRASVIEVKDFPSLQIRAQSPPLTKQSDPLPEFVKAGIQELPSILADITVEPGVTVSEKGKSVKGPDVDKGGRYSKSDLSVAF